MSREGAPELVEHLRRNSHVSDMDGAARLLRKLIRAGLPEEDLLPACALIFELDKQAAERDG